MPPGCQIIYPYIISSNDSYFCYASTMTINVFSIKNFQLKCILNPDVEKMIKCLCLNQGNSDELAVYFEDEILIFNILQERVIDKIKCNEPLYMEYNRENRLLIVTKKEELFHIETSKKKIEQIKTTGKALIAKWNPFNVKIRLII
jgi:hypothetical protein